MQELLDFFHKNNGVNFQKRKNYLASLMSDITSPQREEVILKLINKYTKAEKIKEKKGIKTPDILVVFEETYVEITSLEVPTELFHSYDFSKYDIIRKINEAINHIIEKDRLGHPEYAIGGVIYLSIELVGLTDILHEKIITKLIEKSDFFGSEIDFLLFMAHPFHDAERNIPKDPIIFIKTEDMMKKVKKIFPDIKLKIIKTV